MAMNKLFTTNTIPQGDLLVDNNGYLIVDNSTGMHAYQWNGTTLVHKDSILVVSTKSAPKSSSVLYDGIYLFRIVSNQIVAYSFNGTSFTTITAITMSLTGSVYMWGCKNPGDQIMVAAVTGGGGTVYLYTFSGTAFTFRNSMLVAQHDSYYGANNMWGIANKSNSPTSSFHFQGYMYTYTVSIGAGPLITGTSWGGAPGPTSNKGKLFYDDFYGTASNMTTITDIDSGNKTPPGELVWKTYNWDGLCFYGCRKASSTHHLYKFDISTNPFTVLEYAQYTPVSTVYAAASANDIMYLFSDAAGEGLSIWGSSTPCVADFEAAFRTGNSPLNVLFTDLSTADPTAWDWDFGDNSTHSTVPSPAHVYTKSGIYDVSLTVSKGVESDTETKLSYVIVDTIIPAKGFQYLLTNTNKKAYKYPNDQINLTFQSFKYNKHSYLKDYVVTLKIDTGAGFNIITTNTTDKFGNCTFKIPVVNFPDIYYCLAFVEITNQNEVFSSNIIRINFYR